MWLQQFSVKLIAAAANDWFGGLGGLSRLLGGYAAAFLQLLIRHRRMQERMIDHFGGLFASIFH